MENNSAALNQAIFIMQINEEVEPIINGMTLSNIREIASQKSIKELHSYLSKNKDNSKLKSLKRSEYSNEPSVFYDRILKTTQKKYRQIRQQIGQLDRLEALTIIQRLGESKQVTLLFGTQDLFRIYDRTPIIFDLLKNYTFNETIKVTSFKAERFEKSDQDFKKIINKMDLTEFLIHDVPTGVSKFDQCEALINNQRMFSGKTELSDLLAKTSEAFELLKRVVNRALKSRNGEIRKKSIKYLETLNLNFKSSDIAIDIFFMANSESVKETLENIILITQKKASRDRKAQELTRISVVIEKGQLELLTSQIRFGQSKNDVMRELFEQFLEKPYAEQLKIIDKTAVLERKEKSHIGSDFMVYHQTKDKLDKFLMRHPASMQRISNALVNYSIENLSWLVKKAEQQEKNQTKKAAQPDAGNQASRPDSAFYDEETVIKSV